jgi:hypothetical protein
MHLLLLPPPLLLVFPIQTPTPSPTADSGDILPATVRAQTCLLHQIPVVGPLPPRHPDWWWQALVPCCTSLMPLHRPGLRCVLRLQPLDAGAAHSDAGRRRLGGALLPTLLRGPGCASVAGFLLVAQGKEVTIGGEGVPRWGVILVHLRAGGLIVKGLALVGDTLHIVVFVAEALPSLVVLLALFVALVPHYGFVGEVGSPEDEGGHCGRFDKVVRPVWAVFWGLS